MERRATTRDTSPVRYREARPRDGLAMWRLRRTKTRDDSMSPFFYLAVLQRMRHSCVVAVEGGELVGYVVARRSELRASLRVFDLVVSPAHDTATVAGGLLSRLVKHPANAGVAFLDAVEEAHGAVGEFLAAASAFPSSDSGGNGDCSATPWDAGAPPPASGWTDAPSALAVQVASRARGTTA